jgi:hypothetical protein
VVTHRLRTAGRQARVTRLVGQSFGFLAAITDTSGVATALRATVDALRRSWNASATERGTSRGIAASYRLLAGSILVTHAERLASPVVDTTRGAVADASITALAKWGEGAVRSSWLYRWLTAEPEPDVIVIDLRETVSVGPVIALIDRTIRWLIPASHHSTLVGVAEALSQSVRSAPVRAASLILGVAVLANLALAMTIGEPTLAGVLARVVVLGLAALGTRVSLSRDELVETRAVQLLIAVLEPPEPPEEYDEP